MEETQVQATLQATLQATTTTTTAAAATTEPLHKISEENSKKNAREKSYNTSTHISAISSKEDRQKEAKSLLLLTPLLDDYRLCRITPAPKEGEPPVEMEGLAMPVEYQCAGKPYDEFVQLLQTVVASHSSSNSGSRWGKRRRIIPDDPDKDKQKHRAILIMGNSHTRQLVSTLLCQFKDQIIQFETLYSIPGLQSYGVLQITLQHNLTIYAATNCPFVYAENWYHLLETDILKRKLNTLTAIVLGRFNHYTESTGTKFYQIMMKYQTQFPELGIDFQRFPAPTVADVANVYAGPIVWVGMFAKYGDRPHREANKMIDDLNQLQPQDQATHPYTTQSNRRVRAIYGRRYIQQMLLLDSNHNNGKKTKRSSTTSLPVQECSSDTRHIVTTCITNTTSYRYQNGHRCMGAYGGHPDLIAWDLIEALHELI